MDPVLVSIGSYFFRAYFVLYADRVATVGAQLAAEKLRIPLMVNSPSLLFSFDVSNSINCGDWGLVDFWDNVYDLYVCYLCMRLIFCSDAFTLDCWFFAWFIIFHDFVDIFISVAVDGSPISRRRAVAGVGYRLRTRRGHAALAA